MPTFRYIAAHSYGSGNGSSYENAAAISSLNGYIADVAAGGPGGAVFLRAGDHITNGIPVLNSGGTDQNNIVTIQGANRDGRPGMVYFEGSRRHPYDGLNAGTSVGGDGFQFNGRTTSNLTFDNLYFRNYGAAFVTKGGLRDTPTANIKITNLRVENCQRVLFANTGRPFLNLLCEDWWVKGFSKAALRFNTGNWNVTMRRFTLDGDHQSGDNFSVGIVIGNKGSDGVTQEGNFNFLIEDGVIRNIWDNVDPAGVYIQGDGISSEANDRNQTFRNLVIEDTMDGGIDTKASHVRFDNVIVRRAKRNFRIWGSDVVFVNCQSYTPRLPTNLFTGASSSGSACHVFLESPPSVPPLWLGGIMDNEGQTTAIFDNDVSPPPVINLGGDAVLRYPLGSTVDGSGTIYHASSSVRFDVRPSATGIGRFRVEPKLAVS